MLILIVKEAMGTEQMKEEAENSFTLYYVFRCLTYVNILANQILKILN